MDRSEVRKEAEALAIAAAVTAVLTAGPVRTARAAGRFLLAIAAGFVGFVAFITLVGLLA
ncbi:MAG TPA: hypothetical protein VG651_08550 [Stellaceae bacterium]|nr:hypothetical protein [Stellaceae bacterium]